MLARAAQLLPPTMLRLPSGLLSSGVGHVRQAIRWHPAPAGGRRLVPWYAGAVGCGRRPGWPPL